MDGSEPHARESFQRLKNRFPRFCSRFFKHFFRTPLMRLKKRLNKMAESGIFILRDKKLPLPLPDRATQKGNVHLLHSLKPMQ